MDEQSQQQAIEALRDWSKWLIGLNVFSAAGCVTILEGGVGSNLKPFLVGAILFFALSGMVAALLIVSLAGMVQRCPLQDEEGTVKSIFDHHVWQKVSLRLLISFQLVLFALGVLNLLIWVALKPIAT